MDREHHAQHIRQVRLDQLPVDRLAKDLVDMLEARSPIRANKGITHFCA